MPGDTMPVTLAGADELVDVVEQADTKITIAAEHDAARLGVVGRRAGRTCRAASAAANATMNPTNIAMPPTSGIGSVCTVRSSGRTTQPNAHGQPPHERRGDERDDGGHRADQQVAHPSPASATIARSPWDRYTR